MELPSRYDHTQEDEIYGLWEKSGFFSPEKCVEEGVAEKDAEPFSIALPPPNVTGTLHIGHAFEHTLQDIMVRYFRMRGRPTLWIPGTDHAAIATQAKVEKILQKEDKTKYDLGRENFLKRVEDFAKESHDTIVRQMRRLGGSFDWSREAYTLDNDRSFAVKTAFKTMYDLGLIYRGERVINWDPKGQTVISDDEVVHEERPAKLYTFRYEKNFPIPVSTTRPETKLGDTAVAVHPNDSRYKKFIGKEFDIENFAGVSLKIKVVADMAVDKDFGTGAVGVTPAHSITDWEIAQRHNLPLIQIIDERSRMTTGDERVRGKKTGEAREVVVQWLRENDLLEKEEDVMQNLSIAERTGGVVEPLPKLQWFVAVEKEFILAHSKIKGIKSGAKTTLKALMRASVKNRQVKIVPDRFEKIYFHWIDNLRDWCISRQLWFGHRVPAWYRSSADVSKKENVYIGVEAPAGKEWEQDEDTLDTWFSSGMWTFSTLGWPRETEDFKKYRPISLMNPGYEILFMWVARMILMSGCLLGEIPFRVASIHGMVRDKQNRKFSKSLGNGIDPLELANTYGADALRMSLVVGSAPGNDVKFDEEKVRGYRNFATKIWNAARFVLMNKPAEYASEKVKFGIKERKYLKELEKIKNEVAKHIENFEFHLAAEKAYHYTWHTFADKIIEEYKSALKDGKGVEKAAAYALLETILIECLTMLHPFMPFVTESVYQHLKPGELLMVKRWGQ